MPEPCEQRETISNINRTLERMEQGQRDIVELLKITSNLTPRIQHLEETYERDYMDRHEMGNRLRDVEMTVAESGPAVREHLNEAIVELREAIELFGKKVDKINRAFRLITSKPALVVIGSIVLMIVSGTVLDLMYHRDTLVLWYHFVKG